MTSRRPLTGKDKDSLAQRVLDVHRTDPDRLRDALPEVADLLDELERPLPSPAGNAGLIGLTARERNFHREELDQLLSRCRTLTVAEAVKGLEHGANLLAENNFVPKPELRQELLKLVRKATGIRPRKTGKPVEKVLGDGSASRVVPVVRGIDLHLTWEFKLVKVTLDPEQCRLFEQLTSIIGIGRDFEGATDVAENHDDYYVEAIESGD